MIAKDDIFLFITIMIASQWKSLRLMVILNVGTILMDLRGTVYSRQNKIMVGSSERKTAAEVNLDDWIVVTWDIMACRVHQRGDGILNYDK